MKHTNNLKIWLLVLGFLMLKSLAAQTQISLDLITCYNKAEQNYPLINQYGLLDKSEQYSLKQISSGNLPRIHLGGQWSYQSDVTEIPFQLPNLDVPAIDKDQYKLYVDVSQPLTDLFTTQKNRKDLIKKEAVVQNKALDIEIYKLKERINQVYFGILLLDKQISQIYILKKQLESGIKINQVAVDNGIALKSSTRLLETENLKIEKRLIDLKVNRIALIERLALFIGEPINEDTVFEEPEEITFNTQIKRPELNLFEAQKEVYQSQKQLINSQNLPSLSLFAQGGYAKPALNMLLNESDLYYLTGLRLSWDISRFYTQKTDKEQLNLKQGMIDIDQETFLFNINQSLQAHLREIDKLNALIIADEQIIEQRKEISRTAEVQLENGVLTTNDYITYLNDEDEAKQELFLHQIMRLKTMYDYKTTSGN